MSTAPESPVAFDAFISHASQDRDAALELVSRLEERGFSCWIAPRNIRFGYSFPSEIVRGIERSRCVVVIHSEAANGSVHVANEVKQAFDRQKIILPIRIEEVSLSEELSYYLSARHRIEASHRRVNDYLDEVIATLKADVSALKAPVRRRSRRGPWVIPAATGAGVVLAVAALLLLDRDNDGPDFKPPTTEELQRITRDALEASMGREREAARAVKADEIQPRLSGYHPQSGSLSFRIEFATRQARQAFGSTELYYRFNDGPEKASGSNTLVVIENGDPEELGAIRTLALRFELRDGASIGPFTYPFNPAGMEAEEERARQHQELDHAIEGLSIGGSYTVLRYMIENHLGAIRSVALGHAPDQLDQVYELPTDRSGFPEGNADSFAIAVFPRGPKMYARVDLTDGTSTRVHELRSFPEEGLHVAELEPLERSDRPELRAFVVSERANLPQIVATSRANAVRWRIAADDIRYPEVDEPGQGFYVRTWVKLTEGPATKVLIAWDDRAGQRHGPVAFKLTPVVDVFRRSLKDQIATSGLKPRVRGVVVKAAAATGGQHHYAAQQQGVVFPVEGEGVALFPVGQEHGPTPWASVAEMRFGTSDTTLDVRVPVVVDVNHLLQGGYFLGTAERPYPWHAVVALNGAQYVFAQAVFHDGTTSETMRFPVGEMPVVE